jgi:hypothetical protein
MKILLTAVLLLAGLSQSAFAGPRLVPEPGSTAALLGVGLCVVAFAARKLKK